MNLRSLVPPRHVRREWLYNAAARFGAYRRLRGGGVHGASRLVFVCKGNICRSPFAEAVARHFGAEATSFGLDTRPGLPANAAAIAAGKRFGISLEAHLTRQFNPELLSPEDLVVAMEPSHVRSLSGLPIGAYRTMTLLGMWAWPPRPYLFDPYGMSDREFDRCFGVIHAATRSLVTILKMSRSGS